MTKYALLFPGQGAQFIGMGKEFYDTYSIVREIFEEAEDFLKYKLSKIVFEGPKETLMETRYCQVALFVVSMAILQAVQKEFPDLPVAYTGGLSLGEYSALVASQKAEFMDVLKVVSKRGAFMHEATKKVKTSMSAVLGLSEDEIRKAGYYIANVNSPGQIVIAGQLSEMEKASEDLKKKGAKRVIPLDVAGAYHTPYMDEAKDCLKPFIEELGIMSSDIGLVMNVVGDFVEDSQEIKANLIKQVSSSTRWADCMNALIGKKPDRYVEIGPSLLTGMCRKFGIGNEAMNIEKIKDLEQL